MIVVMLAAAQLPPPPEPEAAANGNAGLVILLVSGGLAVVAILALMLTLLRRRTAASHPESELPENEPPPAPTYRIDHWRDGEAETLGYTGFPEAKDELFADYVARMRARKEAGSVVLVEQGSDELIALAPLEDEKHSNRYEVGDTTESPEKESQITGINDDDE